MSLTFWPIVKFDGSLSKRIVAQPRIEKLAIASVWKIAESFIVRGRAR